MGLYLAIVIALVLWLAPPARAQTMGELNAAQGIHSTLTRQGTSGQANTIERARKSLDESNARHNKWQEQADEDESDDSDRRPSRHR